MALSDTKPPRVGRKNNCGIAKLELSDSERAILNGWLDDDKFSATAIAERLAEDDYHVSYQIVTRHRGHSCGCYAK